MNLYLRGQLDRVFMSIFRNLMTFDEIIELEYQVRIIIKISLYFKYFLTEEGFTELLTNNIPIVLIMLDLFSVQNSHYCCYLSSKRKKI